MLGCYAESVYCPLNTNCKCVFRQRQLRSITDRLNSLTRIPWKSPPAFAIPSCHQGSFRSPRYRPDHRSLGASAPLRQASVFLLDYRDKLQVTSPPLPPPGIVDSERRTHSDKHRDRTQLDALESQASRQPSHSPMPPREPHSSRPVSVSSIRGGVGRPSRGKALRQAENQSGRGYWGTPVHGRRRWQYSENVRWALIL